SIERGRESCLWKMACLEGSSSASASASESESLEEISVVVKWKGREYRVQVCGDESVGELKRRICEVTNVLPKRQKLLCPLKFNDATLFSTLSLKSSLKITMMGTVEDEIIVDPVDSPKIIDDFELGQDDAAEIKDKEVNKQKLKRRIEQYK
ncbi:hypothetical protein KI387_013117, partial [Taxus chinensis]